VRLKGLAITVDAARCTKCGTCVTECFMQAITLGDTAAVHDDALCKGCGRCATVCPSGAVSISLADADAAVNELVERIRERVDIE